MIKVQSHKRHIYDKGDALQAEKDHLKTSKRILCWVHNRGTLEVKGSSTRQEKQKYHQEMNRTFVKDGVKKVKGGLSNSLLNRSLHLRILFKLGSYQRLFIQYMFRHGGNGSKKTRLLWSTIVPKQTTGQNRKQSTLFNFVTPIWVTENSGGTGSHYRLYLHYFGRVVSPIVSWRLNDDIYRHLCFSIISS